MAKKHRRSSQPNDAARPGSRKKRPRRAKKKSRKHAALIFKPNQRIGAAPGTLEAPEDAQPTQLQVIVYGPDSVTEKDDVRLEELAALQGSGTVVWLNVIGLSDVATFIQLGEMFGLHALALEDVMNVRQRPKVEEYGKTAFVVLRMPTPPGQRLVLEQLSMFVGDGYVITIQERVGDCLDSLRRRIRENKGRVRKTGADYLGYAVIDAIVDNYYPLVEKYAEGLEALEEQLLSYPDAELVAHAHNIRHDLHALRRCLWPTREAISSLTRGELGVFTEETRLYLRDCADHAAQLIDMEDACRVLSGGLVDLYTSGAAHRMNEIMKLLTLISTIFIPLGFIAGIYGMNFERADSPWNMPELGWYFGYPFALGLMAVTAISLLFAFRRKGWLGGRRAAPKMSRAS